MPEVGYMAQWQKMLHTPGVDRRIRQKRRMWLGSRYGFNRTCLSQVLQCQFKRLRTHIARMKKEASTIASAVHYSMKSNSKNLQHRGTRSYNKFSKKRVEKSAILRYSQCNCWLVKFSTVADFSTCDGSFSTQSPNLVSVQTARHIISPIRLDSRFQNRQHCTKPCALLHRAKEPPVLPAVAIWAAEKEDMFKKRKRETAQNTVWTRFLH